MALALYRKYRPRTFAEVIGQEHVTEPLSQALRSGRLNHAYLFSGPRGCGKTSSARILARSLNCEQGPTPEPCGQCSSCRELATDGGSIDVLEIDAASHGGVDDARELREKAIFAPAKSRFKIYVIDEAHMVSSAGFNALLKLVEEPPEYVKFIFATTEPEKVLGTIKSRTHHYPFRLIPPKVLRPYLEQLCEAEGVAVEQAVFPLVVRAGGGSARDSLSVLDQLIAGAGPEGVTYSRAAALLGVTDAALIDEMCDALAAGDGASAYATVDRVAEAGHDARRFASDLLERLRDLIVLQQVPDAAAKGLIDGPTDQIERMAAQAQRLGPATLSRCADIVHNGLVEMRGTTAPRLLLELICARMLLPGADDTTGGLLQRLERMERRLTLAGTDAPPAAAGPAPVTSRSPVRPDPTPATPQAYASGVPAASPEVANAGASGGTSQGAGAAAPTGPSGAAPGGPTPTASVSPVGSGDAPVSPAGPGNAPVSPAASEPAAGAPRRVVPPSAVMPDPATPAPPRPGAAATGALDAVAVRRVWPEVVGKVNRSNKRIAALMRDAVVRDLDGDTLVVTVKSSVLAKMMSDHAQVLTDALYEELGGRWQIRCEVAGERGGASLGGSSRSAAPARPTSPPPGAPVPQPPVGPTGDVPTGDSHGGGVPSGGQPSGGSSNGGVAGGAGAAAARAGTESWPEPARPGAAADNDEGWPEPARPGGAATGAGGEDDWPEPARPGGVSTTGASDSGTLTTVTPTAAGSTARSAGAATASATAAPAVPKPAGPSAVPQQAAPAGPPVSSAIAAARAAAAGRGPRTGQAARKTADADWAGEPPYDPDFDGPVRGGGGRPGEARPAAAPNLEGFDPGDEPLDEVLDERTARESSEEQAVRLLREVFGAEKIDEVDAR
ncbi:DNA polymerase III subunit gamma and tau [Micromonospora peucetia]|uniref:DNA polymerase III subunit gamma/tau n=1 Tax=Micromonospora peucetia TaxID=47871 RepID=A0A1C6V179_9ACTN|nr:DNA polymerase III subunit gamma and tau [Micromonospora peucetia]WSA35196.1 DNA polymerase III subunit gamma and tau [Micromonospora peucetia]SCL60046.1 DNA polymerase-3 subunit gamma/tau [Micromonospora peucetia]